MSVFLVLLISAIVIYIFSQKNKTSYVESNLIPGEKVLYKTGLHWVVLVGPIVVGVFFGLAGLGSFLIGSIRDKKDEPMTGVVYIIIAAVCVLLGFLGRKVAEMAVTIKRVIIKTGLLRRRTFELLLSKVESISVDEGLLGRMLGYGTVIVRGTGGTPEPFSRVEHPLELRRQVRQQIETSEQNKLTSHKIHA